ncbi:MAG: septation protein SpoVG [Erysipelotrichia bacterium]|nr:septation protein SpoVG [Erysipelotrichia bacterium]
MQITDIRIQLLKSPRTKLIAFASITIDDTLVIKDFQIFSSVKGFFVGMPSRKMPDGEWRETVFSLNTEFADYVSGAILRAFADEQQKPENIA